MTHVSAAGHCHDGAAATSCHHLVMDGDDPIDWTGVEPDQSPVAPLDAHTFVLRLRLLGDRAASLTVLREAFVEQHRRGQQRPRPSEPAARSAR